MRRCPRHARCDLVIRTSEKNPVFTGLYCQNHGTHLYWLNSYQVGYMTQLGVPNESHVLGLYWDAKIQGPKLNPSYETRELDQSSYEKYYMQDTQDCWNY